MMTVPRFCCSTVRHRGDPAHTEWWRWSPTSSFPLCGHFSKKQRLGFTPGSRKRAGSTPLLWQEWVSPAFLSMSPGRSPPRYSRGLIRAERRKLPSSHQMWRGAFFGFPGCPPAPRHRVAKVLYLRKHGLELAALRWLNLPEFIVFSLGASPASEYSLTSRTGFLRVDEDGPWMAMLDYLGVPETFLPPLVDAGTSLGTLSQDSAVPSPFRGALLSVAGHDHLVSAVSSGDIPPDRYHVSCGTAEVLLRVLSTPLTRQARERLGAELINCVRHVTPHTWVLVAGTKSGLVAGRALQL